MGQLIYQQRKIKASFNNPVIAIGDDGVVIIDSGSSTQIGQFILQKVAEITNKPITHVLTSHIHGDHWLGNYAIYERFS